jgi:putative transposase
MNQRRELVDEQEPMSIRDQCGLLGLSRSSYYHECQPERAENLELMRRLDELPLKHPVYGSRKRVKVLEQEGQVVNRKRVVRLLRRMGIEAIHPKSRTSTPSAGHRIYPYLLKGLEIQGPDEVWCADITCIPLRQGFMYLVAVMDWWSRCVLAWEISNTLESDFCVRAWERALAQGRRVPDISNTDQGSPFTSEAYLEAVESAGASVSMDGRGRWIDNRFIERLWRSVKYEEVYLRDYLDGLDLGRSLGKWFADYNESRPHQALNYACPADVYQHPESHGARSMK